MLVLFSAAGGIVSLVFILRLVELFAKALIRQQAPSVLFVLLFGHCCPRLMSILKVLGCVAVVSCACGPGNQGMRHVCILWLALFSNDGYIGGMVEVWFYLELMHVELQRIF